MLYPVPYPVLFIFLKKMIAGCAVSEKILFPSMIEKLPEIAIPLPGVCGRLFQGAEMQAVFFSVEAGGEISPHAHQAQWGVVLEGEMELTVDGQTRRYGRGDSYFIAAGAVHSIRMLTPLKVLDVFDEPDRYTVKKNPA
jgi:quercetin dioxygenase-like cupin family protein